MSNFKDVIDNYQNGATGEVTTPSGEAVSYTVNSNVGNTNWGELNGTAKVGQGNGEVEVNFDAPVENVAIYFSSSNSGEQYLVEVDGEIVDLNDLIEAGDVQLHSFGGNQIVDSNGALTATGSWQSMDVAVLEFKIPITSVGVQGDGSGGGWDAFVIGFAGPDLPCFCAGTMIETPDGPKPIEDIGPGDDVLTLDHGAHRVLWSGQRRCSAGELQAFEKRRPIRFAADALGPGYPSKPVWLSRQHRVFLPGATPGDAGVLVPAIRLTELPGVTVPTPLGAVTYHHVLLEQHAILQAHWLLCESLFWGARADDVIQGATHEILAGLTAREQARVMTMAPARPFVARAKHVLGVLQNLGLALA
jgi:hypothetical protein